MRDVVAAVMVCLARNVLRVQTATIYLWANDRRLPLGYSLNEDAHAVCVCRRGPAEEDAYAQSLLPPPASKLRSIYTCV